MAAPINIDAYSDALVVLGTAGIVIPLMRRWGLNPVLGYLAAGAVLGPLGLGSLIGELPFLYWITVVDAKNVAGIVKEQAEAEGLDQVFIKAGFEWREPGCSMCLAMNPDKLKPEERCASTSNRNFEGRQGAGGRTHLVSPAMAAAAAIAGRIADVREVAR